MRYMVVLVVCPPPIFMDLVSQNVAHVWSTWEARELVDPTYFHLFHIFCQICKCQGSNTVDGIKWATLWCSGALQVFRHKTLGHEAGPEKSSWADIRCTRFLVDLRVFFVSIGTLGLRIFGDRTNSLVFTCPKRRVPGQVWLMDEFWEQQVSLQVFSDIYIYVYIYIY